MRLIKALHLLTLSLIIGCLGTLQAQTTNSALGQIDISFKNDGLNFSGTLFVAKERKPQPALVIAHGSGKEGRHLRGYQYMGRMFAEFGFATYVFDKRGVGESEGKYVEATDISIPAGDLIAAVRAIKDRPEVDQTRIGVLGISQGGWVAPLAATRSDDISFVVSLVGGGVSVIEQVLHHRKSELVAAGWPEEKIKPAMEFTRKLLKYVSTGVGYQDFKDEYAQAAASAEWFSFIRAIGFGDRLITPEALKKLDSDWFKSLAYDPRETEERINVPYLIILGERDEQVPTAEAAKALRRAFQKSGFEKYKIVTLPREGHNIFKIENGVVSFRESFKKPLLDWLAQFKNKEQ